MPETAPKMTKELLNKKDIERVISRMAHEIIEKNKGTEDLCLIGIQRGGVHIAKRLSARIRDIENVDIAVGSLDISLYRDDLGMRRDQPVVRKTDIPCDITGRKIVLVDDVLFTGRPAVIQLAVLIDRGHRELPIRADYVGKNIPTSMAEKIEVQLAEESAEDRVVIVEEEK